MEMILCDDMPVYLVDGLHPETKEVVKFGITQEQTKRLEERGNSVRLAQFRFMVAPGLITARYVFRGLKRPLQYGDNLDGDTGKYVYSWKPTFDYDWPHARRFDGGIGVVKRDAPGGKVFVVIATPNEKKADFLKVDFWIESNWTWVEEAGDCPYAPIGWNERYEERTKLYDN